MAQHKKNLFVMATESFASPGPEMGGRGEGGQRVLFAGCPGNGVELDVNMSWKFRRMESGSCGHSELIAYTFFGFLPRCWVLNLGPYLCHLGALPARHPRPPCPTPFQRDTEPRTFHVPGKGSTTLALARPFCTLWFETECQ